MNSLKIKKCKCGADVRPGKTYQYYKNKAGKRIRYEYPHNQCQPCVNKTKYKAI